MKPHVCLGLRERDKLHCIFGTNAYGRSQQKFLGDKDASVAGIRKECSLEEIL